MNKKAVFRNVSKKDIQGILQIYSPFVTEFPISFELDVPSKKEMWNRVEGITKELPFMVCEVDKIIAGYAYATHHRIREAYKWSKEISVYVHPDFRRKNIAFVLYSILFEILKFQGVKNLLAGITIPNPGSIRFHEKMGFKKIGEYSSVGYKLGKWHNVGWWELNLNSGELPPENELTPFAKIKNSNIVKNALTNCEEIIIF